MGYKIDRDQRSDRSERDSKRGSGVSAHAVVRPTKNSKLQDQAWQALRLDFSAFAPSKIRLFVSTLHRYSRPSHAKRRHLVHIRASRPLLFNNLGCPQRVVVVDVLSSYELPFLLRPDHISSSGKPYSKLTSASDNNAKSQISCSSTRDSTCRSACSSRLHPLISCRAERHRVPH